VFERFSNDDQGRSRELVCVCYGQDAEARAEFIVLACNTHQDLVDALKLSEAFVSAIVDMTEGKGAICETSVSAPGVTIRRHARQVLPKILKALAKIQK
jgi:aspartate/glutamate racemase